jgi:hypothetical protein
MQDQSTLKEFIGNNNMRENPCIVCIVRPICVATFYGDSVLDFSYNHKKCPLAIKFLDNANQEQVNELRILYGLEPYK